MKKSENLEKLKKSNLFFLSLHSKELFHSNFIAWIAERDRVAFKEFFKNFTGIKLPDNYIVEREYENFDLCISAQNQKNKGKGGNVFCIIENKVKSMPYFEQLEKYSDKLKSLGNEDAYKVLLTLSTTSRPETTGWLCKNYEDLARSLKGINISFGNDYDNQILKDYIEFIEALHQLEKEWEIPSKYKDAFEIDDETRKLRIDDLCQKIIYSKILNAILDKLEQKCVIGSSLKNLKKYEGDEKVFAECGLSRSIGLLEVKVKVKKDYVLGIQLQGSQYRYLAEALDGEAIHKKCEKNDGIFNFVFNDEVCALKKQKKSSINKNGVEYPYCKFGDSFMYRYRNVSEKGTEEIIKEIVEDCKKLIHKA